MPTNKKSLLMPLVRHIPKMFGADFYDHQEILKMDNAQLVRFKSCIEEVCFHYKNGKIIFDSLNINNNLLNLILSDARFLCEEPVARKKASTLVFDDRPLIIMVGDGINIYGHWIVDFASKIRAFKLFFPDLDVAIGMPYDAPKYARPLLEEIFGQNIFFVEICEEITYKAKIFFSTGTRRHDFLSEFCGEQHKEVIDNSYIAPCNADKRLYLSRENFNNYRALLNRHEVEQSFIRRGFEVVIPENFSLREQILLFSSADIIAGEAGSALHNCIFSSNSTKFLNLQSSRQNHFIQSSLCWWGGQNCIYVVGQSAGLDWNADFSVEIDEINYAIDYLESGQSLGSV